MYKPNSSRTLSFGAGDSNSVKNLTPASLLVVGALVFSPLFGLAEENATHCLTPSSRAPSLAATPNTEPLPQPSPANSQPATVTSETVDTSAWPPKPWPKGMVWIPGGEFDMGGVGPEARKDEFPVPRVRVDGFWMDATELTNAEFRRFVEATGYITTAEKKPEWEEIKKQLPPNTPTPDDSVFVPGSLLFIPTNGPVKLDNPTQWWRWVQGSDWKHPLGPKSSLTAKDDNLPVVHVSWDDAVAYCQWAGKRLPTEAEWEYASLGGLPARRFTWGDETPSDTFHPANLWQGDFPYNPKALDGYILSAPVDSDKPNAYGLHHMIGNVWEWCSDWFREDYYKTLADAGTTAVNPQGPADSFDPQEPNVPKRVNRGGSFLCDAAYCASYRPAARMKTSPDSGLIHTGFRPVVSDADWRKNESK